MTFKVSEEDDARFEREYGSSNVAVDAVARHLIACGNEVRILAAPEFVPRDRYRDRCGDLLARRLAGWGSFKPVEVKWRTFSFTCCDDFPFPTIIIDRVKGTGLASLYVSVDVTLTFGAFVPANTQVHWLIESVPDFKRGYGPNPQRLCPVQFARFVRLRSEQVSL